MGKYSEMAKTALNNQAEAKAEAKRLAEEGERKRQDALNAERDLLEKCVVPSLREAAKDFQKESIEVQVGTGSSPLYPQATLTLGHNRAGMTASRMAKLVANVEDGRIVIRVESGNGPRRDFTGDGSETRFVDEAILDALHRWTEQGYPKRRG